MKKLFAAKHLSLLMLLSLLGGKAEAARYQDEDGYSASESRDCGSCFSSCYECGCNPLYCGAWDLQIQGGVNPILWRNRAPILGVACPVPPATTSPVIALFNNVPKFRTFFKTPWIVGGQVGYAWSDNVRAYLEFNYSQAKAKSNATISTDFIPTGLAAIPVIVNFNKYKVFDAYAGVRYYWDRWCDRVAFFLGGKVGLTHHKSLSSSLSFTLTTPPATPQIPATPIFRSNTVVSGGANFGLDVCFCGNWSFVLTGEVVASCGPRTVTALTLPAGLPAPANAFSNLIFGAIGTELRFPVTAGIRYSF